jgi:DNA processing protein
MHSAAPGERVAVRGHPPAEAAAGLELESAVALSLLRWGADTRGPRLLRALLDAGADPADGTALLGRLAEALNVPPGERARRVRHALVAARRGLAGAASSGIQVLRWSDPGYPLQLAAIPDPPIVLWVRGDCAVLSRAGVAVVGSRRATPTGLAVAGRISGGLADAGLVVVSGMARGVDAAAHGGALDAGGATVAVLGSGIDVIYPPEHGALAHRIARCGALVSEFPPGTPPLPPHFPLRNRIISGLSRAVVVVEASRKSGSLITARAGLEQGRDVLAVPGNVLSGRNQGCHALIKDGARLVETVTDVLDETGWRPPRAAPPAGAGPETTSNLLHLNWLEAAMAAGEAYSVDDLAARTGRPAPELLAELGGLELAGRVVRMPGGGYVRLDEPAMDR